ncbi:hypothetical protein ACA910_016569 [Epithemia clementina (nom. ined.)]
MLSLLRALFRAWNQFFHARVDQASYQLGGYMRIAYAVIFLVDKIFWTMDLNEIFSNRFGLVPYSIGQQHSEASDTKLSLFQLAPDSDALLWTIQIVGLVQGFLLLLGIAPRFQLFGIFVHLVSFQHHNYLLSDQQDLTFRIWSFLLLFLPVHTVTIYDFLAKAKPTNEKLEKDAYTWPIWPYRIWQLHLTVIYLAASLGKLEGEPWQNGLAIYYVSHTDDFYPGIFNPDILFNRWMPLKVATWSALLIELVIPYTIWIPALRKPTLFLVLLLHIGIELSMNMHCFEWLTVLGWASFLANPVILASSNTTNMKTITTSTSGDDKKKPTLSSGSSFLVRSMTNLLVITVVGAFWMDCFPASHVQNVFPTFLEPLTEKLCDIQNWYYATFIFYHELVGLDQGYWNMFGGYPDQTNYRMKAEIEFNFDESDVVVWHSPDWSNMTKLERKRQVRPMNYYEHVSTTPDSAAIAWLRLCQVLANKYSSSSNHGKNVTRVTLRMRSENAAERDPSDSPGWFAPARTIPMEVYPWETLVTLKNNCMDSLIDCDSRAEQGQCSTDEETRTKCTKACETCHYFFEFPNAKTWYHAKRLGSYYKSEWHLVKPEQEYDEEDDDENNWDDEEDGEDDDEIFMEGYLDLSNYDATDDDEDGDAAVEELDEDVDGNVDVVGGYEKDDQEYDYDSEDKDEDPAMDAVGGETSNEGLIWVDATDKDVITDLATSC